MEAYDINYTANRINLHFRKNVETTFVLFVPLVFIFEYLSYRDGLISIILILLSLRCRASWLRSNGDRWNEKYKTDRDYQVWQEGVHPQQIQNQAIMR